MPEDELCPRAKADRFSNPLCCLYILAFIRFVTCGQTCVYLMCVHVFYIVYVYVCRPDDPPDLLSVLVHHRRTAGSCVVPHRRQGCQ